MTTDKIIQEVLKYAKLPIDKSQWGFLPKILEIAIKLKEAELQKQVEHVLDEAKRKVPLASQASATIDVIQQELKGVFSS